MKDRLFLATLHDKIASRGGMNIDSFCMWKLRSIVNAMPTEQETAIDASMESKRSAVEHLKAKGRPAQ